MDMDKRAVVLIGCHSGNEGKSVLAKDFLNNDVDALLVYYNTDEVESHIGLRDARKFNCYYASTCSMKYDVTEDHLKRSIYDADCEVESIFDIKGKMKDYTETRIYVRDLVGKDELLRNKLTDLDWKYTGVTRDEVKAELNRFRRMREYIRVSKADNISRKYNSFVLLGNSGLEESFESGLMNAKEVLEALNVKDVRLEYITTERVADKDSEIYRSVQEDLKNIKTGCKFDKLEVKIITNSKGLWR